MHIHDIYTTDGKPFFMHDNISQMKLYIVNKINIIHLYLYLPGEKEC